MEVETVSPIQPRSEPHPDLPEEVFLRAVLNQALRDLTDRSPRIRQAAHDWVASEDCTLLCELAGFDADRLRQGVQRRGWVPAH